MTGKKLINGMADSMRVAGCSDLQIRVAVETVAHGTASDLEYLLAIFDRGECPPDTGRTVRLPSLDVRPAGMLYRGQWRGVRIAPEMRGVLTGESRATFYVPGSEATRNAQRAAIQAALDDRHDRAARTAQDRQRPIVKKSASKGRWNGSGGYSAG